MATRSSAGALFTEPDRIWKHCAKHGTDYVYASRCPLCLCGAVEHAITTARRSVVDAINELHADTEPGKCPFCWEPMPERKPGRQRVHCGSKSCRRSYQRVYGVQRRRGTYPARPENSNG